MLETRTKRLKSLHMELKHMKLFTEDGGTEEFEKRCGLTSNSLTTEEGKSFANELIGGALFKGGPNKNGEVEIGYGLNEDY
jgi:hypothetical protein